MFWVESICSKNCENFEFTKNETYHERDFHETFRNFNSYPAVFCQKFTGILNEELQ